LRCTQITRNYGSLTDPPFWYWNRGQLCFNLLLRLGHVLSLTFLSGWLSFCHTNENLQILTEQNTTFLAYLNVNASFCPSEESITYYLFLVCCILRILMVCYLINFLCYNARFSIWFYYLFCMVINLDLCWC
jgi:hypothetical protein